MENQKLSRMQRSLMIHKILQHQKKMAQLSKEQEDSMLNQNQPPTKPAEEPISIADAKTNDKQTLWKAVMKYLDRIKK